jgi:putative transcriptional regulator
MPLEHAEEPVADDAVVLDLEAGTAEWRLVFVLYSEAGGFCKPATGSRCRAANLMAYQRVRGDAMSKRKQYRSGVLASVHETAEGLTGVGVMSKQTMREFDELCLTPVRPLTPEEIRNIREREGASQAVFARYLNVTTGLVSQWERGEKHPQGASLKLLALVAKNGLNGVA